MLKADWEKTNETNSIAEQTIREIVIYAVPGRNTTPVLWPQYGAV